MRVALLLFLGLYICIGILSTRVQHAAADAAPIASIAAE